MSEKPKKEEEVEESGEIKQVKLSRPFRLALFVVLITIEMAINVHSGVLSSASKIIKKRYSMDDKTFSLFGLSQGIGRTCGTTFFILTCNTLSIKWLVSVFTLVKALVCIAFKFTDNGWALIGLRGILGICHMPPSTYIPIWIDQYGLRNYKTVQMSLLQALVPVGKVLGYFFQMIFEEKWVYGFVIEGIYLAFCGTFCALSPPDYFNAKVVLLRDHERKGEFAEEKYKDESIFHRRGEEKKKEDGGSDSNLFTQVCTILKNPSFHCAAWSKVFCNGSQSCIHFWTADFMRNRLGVDSARVFFSYTVMSVAGPCIGFIISPILNKTFGSYETKHAPYVLFGLHLITTCFGLAATLVNHFLFFCVSLCLFFGLLSLCLSMIHGCIMFAVGPELKALAYSMANVGTNIIGAGTFPTIYGAMNDFCYPRGIKFGGMLSIMIINGASSVLSFILGILRVKEFEKMEKEKLIEDKGTELEEK